MPLINQNFPQLAPKSERVVKLLAACIRSAVRFRYPQLNLSQTDAIDLARIHDLQSALRTISTKMEVHQSLLSEQRRFMLAVNEAKLVSDADIGTENIIAIREASIAVLRSTSDATSSQRHLVVASLRIGLQEVRLWAKAYSRFLTEIESLYKSTNARIVGLRLSSTVRRKAQLELEQIIVDATRRAGEINSSH
jgi:hypothetical protein